MTEVRMERCFAMPALAMVEVLHTLNGPPGYFSKWIPMVIPNLLEVYSRGQEWALYQAKLFEFFFWLRFLMCKRKQVKVRTSTLLQNPQPSPPWCWIIPIDIAKPQLLQTCRRMSRPDEVISIRWEMMVCFEVLQHTTHHKIWLLASTSWCPPTSLMGASLSLIVFVDIAELLNQWHLYCHPKRAQYFDTLGGPCCVFRASPFGEARHTHTHKNADVGVETPCFNVWIFIV